MDRIRQRAEQLTSIGSAPLVQCADQLREQVGSGVSVTSPQIVVEAFALMTEALRRSRSKVYYDVQLVGGMVLAAGAIAEIQTGEGKTITTALPAFLHSLNQRGVHVATTNDYLSQRDCEEVSEAFSLLGTQVGQLKSQAPPHEKRAAYQCDVTYGPGYEFGFDYLRDQLTLRSRGDSPLGMRHLRRLAGHAEQTEHRLQRDLAFMIVDEADSVLIDEAATPLILSGTSDSACTDLPMYQLAETLASELIQELDYQADPIARSIQFTTEGWDRVHHDLPVAGSGGRLARPWGKVVENALRAKHFLERDVDYAVVDDQVVLVDANTGRLHPERTWRGGLHQAVEVREGLAPTPEKETQARVTRQRFCNLYDGLCGLTGTAQGGEAEFQEFYSLPVVQIPTHRPCIRTEEPSRFFRDDETKFQAVLEDVKQRQSDGRPLLIGTNNIACSRRISEALSQRRLSHTVLNGVQDEAEADIISLAGQPCRITVATNMAGRGTDIQLAPASREAGGLHVLAVEFHESQRIDRQLAGRAARQGDPGSCQFFAAATDELFLHCPSLANLMSRETASSGEHQGDLTGSVRRLQRQLDLHGLTSRRHMVRHDRWIESVQTSLARQVE